MQPVRVEVTFRAPRSEVWSLISDIERAPETISGIDSVGVLERPGEGILGLRWKRPAVRHERFPIEIPE